MALFEGMLHSLEIFNFLTDPDRMAKYIEGLDPYLRHVYEQNEVCQQAIADHFKKTIGQALSRKFLPFYMRWLAYKAYDGMYGIEKGTTDYGKYRKMLIGIMSSMERQEACFCFSGQSYGNCCEPLLNKIQMIQSMDSHKTPIF
ncbi:TPA: hypothetical protein EYP38_04580 [Candidatus Micrarchaeota archaeon]|nr:hypothetical protein [Candidatus Micrarchaeota archaeon]